MMLSTAMPSLRDGIRAFQFMATDFLNCSTLSGRAVDSLQNMHMLCQVGRSNISPCNG